MEAILIEWGNLLLRWTHIVTGIAWIGSSFYFMHLDASLRSPSASAPKGTSGESWEVHGGGFYEVRKYLVAPDHLPEELTWHKWQAYSTWLSGFCLLIWAYYMRSSLFLIDPTIMALSPLSAAAIGLGSLALGWAAYDALCKSPLGRNTVALAAVGFAFVIAMAAFYQHIFAARAAFVHTGALMATIMAGNVFFVIIPNQRKVVAALKAGQAPDPQLGAAGKQRSAHNNYLTLPVIFFMMSNHYPMTYSSPYAWVVVGLVLVAGALVRVFYNERHAGHGDKWWTWGVAALCMALAIAISLLSSPGSRDQLGMDPLPTPSYALASPPPKNIVDIVVTRCSMCHASDPVWDGIGIAPKGIELDTPQGVKRYAQAIWVQAVYTHAMPPNNVSEMTAAERRTLGAWIATQ